ncbi:MAG TPA: hypothetical protein VFG42_03620 [Baekduia sp.]|uniref:hypothetical protein n=1 Tax=Baekduia sp. TaxID=2600305 RepID=UPI002D790D98|nr:hypothetical protein [Baekduia sp.]HET6505853.1 hypothetical protein [Baekduia sp.]
MYLRTLAIAGLAVAAIPLAGCGTKLNADTSCESFLKAGQQQQDEGVSSVAADLHAGNAVTPLGRPNINYICANHPDMTLGDAVRATG